MNSFNPIELSNPSITYNENTCSSIVFEILHDKYFAQDRSLICAQLQTHHVVVYSSF